MRRLKFSELPIVPIGAESWEEIEAPYLEAVLRGEGSEYRRRARLKRLEELLGPALQEVALLEEIPLGASPFRAEVLLRDELGGVAILQAGNEVYLASSWGYVKAPAEFWKRFARNGVVALRGSALHKVRKAYKSSRELWEKLCLPKGLQEFFDNFITLEELLGLEE